MKTTPTLMGLILMLGLALLMAFGGVRGTAIAADGDLDNSFGGDGKVATDFTDNSYDYMRDLIIQPDGKILTVGSASVGSGGHYDFALIRYLPNGDLDPDFGEAGKVHTDFASDEDDAAYDLLLQPDGKILAVGTTTTPIFDSNKVAVARYLPNGDLDTTFGGSDGKVIFDVTGDYNRGEAVSLQPDGKILVGGYGGSPTVGDFILARLNTNGSLDNTFDGDGKLSYDFYGGDDRIQAIEVQSDGKIVVAGIAYISGDNYDFAVARFNSDGSFDTSFDSDGRVLTDFFGGDDGAYNMTIQPDGKIVVVGSVYYEPSFYNFGVARYLADGSLDSGFGVGGIKAEDVGGNDSAFAVAIQPDGKIVLAGNAVGISHDFAVARFTANGFLDPTFSGDGFVITDILGDSDGISGMAIQEDGKIVVGGTSTRPSPYGYDFTLARYLSGPEVIPTSTSTALPTQTPGGPTATPQGTPTTCPVQFPDVPVGSTFYDYVMCLACRGIISGYPNGTFGPNNSVTRGQLSKIVSNSAGYTESHNEQSFEDVPLGSTFHQFIERLFSRGYISGYACGGSGEPCQPGNRPYFRPNANVTRGQTSKIVASAKGLPAPPPNQQPFEDVTVGSTFWVWIEALATSGAINGYACGSPEPCLPPGNRPYFRPNNQVTRGQSAKIVSNTFFPNCQLR